MLDQRENQCCTKFEIDIEYTGTEITPELFIDMISGRTCRKIDRIVVYPAVPQPMETSLHDYSGGKIPIGITLTFVFFLYAIAFAIGYTVGDLTT